MLIRITLAAALSLCPMLALAATPGPTSEPSTTHPLPPPANGTPSANKPPAPASPPSQGAASTPPEVVAPK